MYALRSNTLFNDTEDPTKGHSIAQTFHLEQSPALVSCQKIRGTALPQSNILPGFQSVSSTPVFQFVFLPLCVLAEV